jgi:hypothetical protein
LNTITINNGFFFITYQQIILLLVGLIVGSFYSIFDDFYTFTFIYIITFSLITFSTGVEVNVSNQTFREYNSFLGIKFGTFKTFSKIEYIYIVQTYLTITGRVSWLISGPSYKSDKYISYLKMDGYDKIYLIERKSRDKIIEDLTSATQKLNMPLYEEFNGELHEIHDY